MVDETNRRSFLKGSGAALAGLALPTATVSARSTEERYIVDLEDTAAEDLDDVTVVHDLSQIDVAVVEGNPNSVSGLRHSKDVEMKFEVDREYGDEDDDRDDDEGEEDDFDGRDYWDDESKLPSRFALQWDKQSQELLEAAEETRGEGTRVSVIDSGAIADHPDLEGPLNADLSRNFTGDGGDFTPYVNDHGTHVAGIIAADGSNEKGILGTAPGTDLVALRVFTGPFAFFGDIIAAMVYSADVGSDVANMSLGVYPLPKDADTATLRDAIERAAAFANERGTLMVAAAGNDGVDLDADGDVLSLPNEADNVMSVSATGPIGYRWDDEDDEERGENDGEERGVDDEDEAEGESGETPEWGRRDDDGELEDFDDPLDDLRKPTTTPATYTNHGREAVDISAPGGNYAADPPADADWQYDMVLSTAFEWGEDDDTMIPAYGWKAGTSMAAPQVSAAAALVKSLNPRATPGDVRRHLVATAEDLDQPTYSGEGHLDLEEAVEEEVEPREADDWWDDFDEDDWKDAKSDWKDEKESWKDGIGD
ncbi:MULTISPECIES: S8 family serine peptidase [Halorussus]|uniref:S8 family serine peptidase n=1 Tax=Halorussus TaxID=1070314 RepID=UPI000E20E1E3|nr:MULTISPECIES: S8 family serine peptidase [Halorussus]NHN59300.1 S8 family serine peptidase [Halorussus sp. JP-T4]